LCNLLLVSTFCLSPFYFIASNSENNNHCSMGDYFLYRFFVQTQYLFYLFMLCLYFFYSKTDPRRTKQLNGVMTLCFNSQNLLFFKNSILHTCIQYWQVMSVIWFTILTTNIIMWLFMFFYSNFEIFCIPYRIKKMISYFLFFLKLHYFSMEKYDTFFCHCTGIV
jgi:hypothetical protein